MVRSHTHDTVELQYVHVIWHTAPLQGSFAGVFVGCGMLGSATM